MAPIGSMVPETISGMAKPTSRRSLWMAEEAGLDVAGILAGFEDQEVGAAFDECLGLIVEIAGQFVEGYAAGDGDRFGGGPHGAGDEAAPARGGELVSDLAGQAGGCAVQFVGLVSQVILAEDDAGTAEGVGLDDVGARFQVGAVDVQDHVRPGLDQVLVAAFKGRAAEIGRS